MKTVKRLLLIFFIIAAAGILFRGWIYRHMVTYKTVGQRTSYRPTNNKLIDCFEKSTTDKNILDEKEVINLALSITAHQLNFRASKNDNDPNKLITSKSAHCVGYAAFFATTCNYLFKKYNLDKEWIALPEVAELYFVGFNMHKWFRSSFFKDHDFVYIVNKKTRESYAVDPSLYDYLWIDFVTKS